MKAVSAKVPAFESSFHLISKTTTLAPVGLADTEVLIGEIIRNRFEKGDDVEASDEIRQRFLCPKCGQSCIESYAEFNIHMYRSTVRFEDGGRRAATGLFLTGFYGFDGEDFLKIPDFQQTESIDDFLGQFRTG
jgi:hypothetical protein